MNFDQVCIELSPLGKLSVLPAKAAPVGFLELVFGHLVGLQLRLAAATLAALWASVRVRLRMDCSHVSVKQLFELERLGTSLMSACQ